MYQNIKKINFRQRFDQSFLYCLNNLSHGHETQDILFNLQTTFLEYLGWTVAGCRFLILEMYWTISQREVIHFMIAPVIMR